MSVGDVEWKSWNREGRGGDAEIDDLEERLEMSVGHLY